MLIGALGFLDTEGIEYYGSSIPDLALFLLTLAAEIRN